MALEPLQIERVRDIIGYTSLDATVTLLTKLNEVQEAETAQDVDKWTLLRGKQTRLKEGGVDIDKDRNRLEIINRVRPRLGLPKITIEELSGNGNASGSYVSYTALHDDDYYCCKYE